MAKPHTIPSSINWPVFFLLFVAAVGAGLLIILWSITRPFCANSLSCKESLSLKVENGIPGVFNGQTIIPPSINLTEGASSQNVLGEETIPGEKHIYIDLTTQTLTAYQGDSLFMTAMIASGKWHETPTGEFRIWEKLKATRMSGGEGADAYDLPNVPYVMFFEGSGIKASQGFGLHGAYWHNNFGHPMSHGCVNMRIVDAQKLYNWATPVATGNYASSTEANPGTKITIYGEPSL